MSTVNAETATTKEAESASNPITHTHTHRQIVFALKSANELRRSPADRVDHKWSKSNAIDDIHRHRVVESDGIGVLGALFTFRCRYCVSLASLIGCYYYHGLLLSRVPFMHCQQFPFWIRRPHRYLTNILCQNKCGNVRNASIAMLCMQWRFVDQR